ncbi:MAG: SAM-dependent methyltransferase [Pseudanabaena sp.]|nr:MAG: SAM-dependent methyltransferase [Pseudanabaena sp.]
MKNNEQAPRPTDSKDFDKKRTWYSPVAEIYYNARPAYPELQINRAVALAQLSSEASVLEIGSGPGNATVAFAQNGFLMTCLEPNPDFCQVAQRNCAGYPNVEVCNTTFEEWQLKERQFDAVLSANSFHWISAEIKYVKAAEALHDNGFLILLWNMTPEPSYEVYQAIKEIYQTHAPSLVRYDGAETQAEILKGFGQEMQDSGYFRNLVMEKILCNVTYSIDQYLNLLSTLRRLEPQVKDLLFAGLREKLKPFGDRIELSFLSAVHVAQKTR